MYAMHCNCDFSSADGEIGGNDRCVHTAKHAAKLLMCKILLMRVMNHNWSAKKQHLHPQCSRDKPPFSFVRGQDSTM